ncbi:hypothetical protein Leryth_023827 [Lithospermum erythrorhizon]|nr:hypothetical protein Leryth_023827 [Lithospermum erythrorhizon]
MLAGISLESRLAKSNPNSDMRHYVVLKAVDVREQPYQTEMAATAARIVATEPVKTLELLSIIFYMRRLQNIRSLEKKK